MDENTVQFQSKHAQMHIKSAGFEKRRDNNNNKGERYIGVFRWVFFGGGWVVGGGGGKQVF